MVQRLDWDSTLFNLRIGKTIISSQEEMDELCLSQDELRKHYDLLYIYSQVDIIVPKINCPLVDQKVIYISNIESIHNSIDYHISEYKDNTVSTDLLNLALLSGHYSRYRLDNKLPSDAYEKLYTIWIDKSVKHIIATDVFCYYLESVPKGLITLNRDNSIGTIGLLATDTLSRGRGIGSSLLRYTKYFCSQNNISTLTVATQKHNKAACRLYESTGFRESSYTNIWHWWL